MGKGYGLDEIDREILQILMHDPRMPYSDIARHLEKVGHKMSSEGVRHRVTKLFEESTIFLLSGPEGNEWEVIRVSIVVKNEVGTIETIFNRMRDNDFWLVCRGLGMYNIHAVATIANISEAEKLVNRLRNFDEVKSVDYFIETERCIDMYKYTLE